MAEQSAIFLYIINMYKGDLTMKSYIFTNTTNPRFAHYCGRQCKIEFFHDSETNLLRATILFFDSRWIKTSIMTTAPKHDGKKMEIHTMNSTYYFEEVEEENV